MNRRAYLASAGTALAGLSGCLGLASGDNYDVGMTAVAFDPVQLTVSVGDEVVWKNTSSRAHTITAYEDGLPADAEFFASGGYQTEAAARDAFNAELGGAVTSGETYSHTFEVPGTYPYFCIPHEQAGMVGTVVVEE